MAAMATQTAAATTGRTRVLCPSTLRLAAPAAATASLRPLFSLSPFTPHTQSTRRLGSLHVAFARNVPAERRTVKVSPPEPEMSSAELRAYEESCAKLQGSTPDFWEGEFWNPLGFTVKYMWAFGVAVAIVGCLTAVRSYNSGATDFKNTDVFKEAIEFQAGDAERSSLPAFEEAP